MALEKEGPFFTYFILYFLYTLTALTALQTAGRAARNVNGLVIMYADKITDSMRVTIDETNRRREKQMAYNKEHNLTPQALKKSKEAILTQTSVADWNSGRRPAKAYIEPDKPSIAADPVVQYMSKDKLEKMLQSTIKQMEKAAKDLDFIEAARLRDEAESLKQMIAEKG